MIKLVNCPICEKTEWHSLDYIRNVEYWYNIDRLIEGDPVGFKVCKTCGFVTYDYQTDEFLQESYTGERKSVGASHYISCNRKNLYMDIMLRKHLKDSGKSVLDVGCAQGSFLNYCRNEYAITDLSGTEWADGFRSFARNEFDINATKEIDESKKYDFIVFYHTLEHMQNPQNMLEKAISVLADDGMIYISVPEYIGMLDMGTGAPTVEFEELFHLNHVNCFSRKSFKNLLTKMNLVIIEGDYNTYGQSVLCKVGEGGMMEYDNWQEVEKVIVAQKEAIGLLKEKKYAEAIERFPDYPDAYLYLALTMENAKNFEAQKEILEKGLNACSASGIMKIVESYGRMHYQFNENRPGKRFYSNNIRKAEQCFIDALKTRPGNDNAMYFLAIINAQFKNDFDKAVFYLRKIIEINPTRFGEMYNLLGSFWFEKGE